MSLVVIAVLAVIWVVALTPMILRKLSERRLTTSVDSFHRQLRGLRRAYPRLAASAANPEMTLSGGRMVPSSRPPTVSSYQSTQPLAAERYSPSGATTLEVASYEEASYDDLFGGAFDDSFADDLDGSPSPDHADDPGEADSPSQGRAGGHRASRAIGHGSSDHSPPAVRRGSRQAARRRRVLLALVAMMLGCFLLGTIPGLRVLWDAALLAFGATAGYVALLIHFHRRAMERAVKVVHIKGRRVDPQAAEQEGTVAHSHVSATWIRTKTSAKANVERFDEERFEGDPVDEQFDESGLEFGEIVAGGGR